MEGNTAAATLDWPGVDERFGTVLAHGAPGTEQQVVGDGRAGVVADVLQARHDNAIKSKAVIDSGRKALYEGRWITQVPKGYDMKTTKSTLSLKRIIQNLIFPDGLRYNKENEDIEPLSKNEFLFTFNLESSNYEEKEKGQTLKFEDLSLDAPLLGLEPRTP